MIDGVGGYYKAHYDFTTKDSPPFSTGNGNRIATVLVYVNLMTFIHRRLVEKLI